MLLVLLKRVIALIFYFYFTFKITTINNNKSVRINYRELHIPGS